MGEGTEKEEQVNTSSSARGVISAAIDAMDAHDAEALAELFVAGGSVEDENEVHTGRAAIRRWFAATPEIALEVLRERSSGPDHEVEAKAHGDYPGSPLTFRYRFRLAGDRIEAVTITPA
ncbi:hypothetical protein GCM10017608_25160 [Agromyces luteolus]|uniref:Nuclear transport factor 2 family protein n=1 Tax=Agromyces luteolus TaxID=88373 RepID=A0A7C9HUA5_9MICO|nr:nuclear transport factor 2 family protein [Agromyces luteolus]MUN07325.1 nuclear transport factor 2 family protein [Agromyces luteolus]GLK28582.1 hypothetical protein GCM10017608_25160 [Agromyces luteolus]